MERGKCALCGRTMARISKHNCPESQEVFALLSTLLPDPDNPGYIVPINVYDATEGIPLSSDVLKRTYGSWSNLARRHGLESRIPRGLRDAPRPQTTQGVMDAACRDELHRLANVLHDGEFGPSISEFQLYADASKIGLTAKGLAFRFGESWRAVLDAAGLKSGTHSEYARAGYARRREGVPANAYIEPPPVAFEYEFVGLPVASVQKPKPIVRRLPSGGTATMIR
mgnify:CR=1 FL=1